MAKRSSGVILHVSSLPGDFGIGTLGKAAYDFVDFLKAAGFSYWQILPLGPTGEYNSPYQCYSAFAGNHFFIDPQGLKEEGLLNAMQVDGFKSQESKYEVDFNWQKAEKKGLLRSAFANITPQISEEIEEFIIKESYWIYDYALFTALKGKYKNLPWWEWPEDIKCYETDAVESAREELKEDIYFEYFCQYTFFKQWKELREYANNKEIKIIGDMPIYVAHDSADTWSKSGLFEIDGSSRSLKSVAGVPPDYFSEDGQLWGNPLYDWEKMKETGYEWWTERLKVTLDMVDVVRIDHFRGFVAYWAVPADSNTAKNGKWIKGPGAALFDVLKEKFPVESIIAEDLGDITEDVREFLEYTGLPGMRVMQFAFLDDGNSCHLPHNYCTNTVAYTGTHDNNTVLGWLWEATEEQRTSALDYCGFEGNNWGDGGYESKACFVWIKTLFASHSNLAIIPIQDICGFGGDTRINKPGIADGNWGFRITSEAINSINKEKFKRLNHLYKRV